MPTDPKISGVFASLSRSPIRLVIRRRVDFCRDQYDVYKPADKIDAVEYVLKVFIEETPDFVEKLLAVDKKHRDLSPYRTRHYVHTDRQRLYGDRRVDLANKASRKISNLWLATNLNAKVMVDVIREACEAAQVDYAPLSTLKW